MIRKTILLVTILIIAICSTYGTAQGAVDHMDRWIDDLFARGMQVDVYEDGSGNAEEPETGTTLHFCIRDMPCTSKPQQPGLVKTPHWLTELVSPILSINMHPDGSGTIYGYEDVVVDFCIHGERCDEPAPMSQDVSPSLYLAYITK